MHNGLQVAVRGPFAYYKGFSSILELNRGVHEPLEEYVFQQLIETLPDNSIMIELGAYWAHYSMWLKKIKPNSRTICVEPDEKFLNVGKHNFLKNGMESEFVQEFVSKNGFQLDEFLDKSNIAHLNILHSDIQGYEGDLLLGASKTLENKLVDYIFISTHSQTGHYSIVDTLKKHNYLIEVSSDVDFETTSFDGFVFASSPNVKRLFKNFVPLGRNQILKTNSKELLEYLSTTNKCQEKYTK